MYGLEGYRFATRGLGLGRFIDGAIGGTCFISSTTSFSAARLHRVCSAYSRNWRPWIAACRDGKGRRGYYTPDHYQTFIPVKK